MLMRCLPVFGHHRRLGRPGRRWRAVLQIVADRGAMPAGLFGDLEDRPSLLVQVVDIHVVLLGHHGERLLQLVSCLVA